MCVSRPAVSIPSCVKFVVFLDLYHLAGQVFGYPSVTKTPKTKFVLFASLEFVGTGYTVHHPSTACVMHSSMSSRTRGVCLLLALLLGASIADAADSVYQKGLVNSIVREAVKFESTSATYQWPPTQMNLFPYFNIPIRDSVDNYNLTWQGVMTNLPYSDEYTVSGLAYDADNHVIFKGGRTGIQRPNPQTDFTVSFSMVATGRVYSNGNTAPVIVSMTMSESSQLVPGETNKYSVTNKLSAVIVDPEIQNCREQLGLDIGVNPDFIPFYDALVNVNYQGNCDNIELTVQWALVSVHDENNDLYTSYTESDYTIVTSDDVSQFKADLNFDQIFWTSNAPQMTFFVEVTASDGYMVSKHVIEIVRSRSVQTSVTTTFLISPIVTGVNVWPDTFLTGGEYESDILNLTITADNVILDTAEQVPEEDRAYTVSWDLLTSNFSIDTLDSRTGIKTIEIDDSCDGLFYGYGEVTRDEVLSLSINETVLTSLKDALEDDGYLFCYLLGTVTDSYADPVFGATASSYVIVRIVVSKDIAFDAVPTFSLTERLPADGELTGDGDDYNYMGHVAAYNLRMFDDGCLQNYDDPNSDLPEGVPLFYASALIAPICNTTTPEGCEEVPECMTVDLSYNCTHCDDNVNYGLFGPCYADHDKDGNPGCFVTFHAIFYGSAYDWDTSAMCAEQTDPSVLKATFEFTAVTNHSEIYNDASLVYTVPRDDFCEPVRRRSIDNERHARSNNDDSNQIIQMVISINDFIVRTANFPWDALVAALNGTDESEWPDKITAILGTMSNDTMSYLLLQFHSYYASISTGGASPTAGATTAPLTNESLESWVIAVIVLGSALGLVIIAIVIVAIVKWRHKYGGYHKASTGESTTAIVMQTFRRF